MSKDHGCIVFVLYLGCSQLRTQIPPTGAPWLTMPLQESVKEVWHFPPPHICWLSTLCHCIIQIKALTKVARTPMFLPIKWKLIILWPSKLYEHLKNSFSYSLIPSLLLNNKDSQDWHHFVIVDFDPDFTSLTHYGQDTREKRPILPSTHTP